ncbi:MAG TPA: AMP-binding protein [bacterium]|nr:AMP-binding protein [bacterium]
MIYRSAAPEVTIPEVSLPQFMLERMAAWGDKPALIEGPSGRTLTYAQLCGAIRACAAGLAAGGFGKGDVMAIYSPNLPEYAVAFYGVALAGGTNTTANPLMTADELAKQLRDAGARYLLTIGTFLDKAQAAAAQAGVERIFTFDAAPGSEAFSALLAGGGEPPAVRIKPAQDVVVLPYSSGTTGLPKGVMLTHRNLLAAMHQLEGARSKSRIDASDTLIAVLPFYHIYGMVVLMSYALLHGATVVTLPRFDLEQFLATLQKHRVTFASLVPPIVVALAKHPLVGQYDLSALKEIGSGAAPLGAEVMAETARRVGCDVRQGYGLTETSAVSHVSPDDPAGVPPGSVGRVVPNSELRIVDPVSKQDVAPGERGELWIRGPQVMKGYLNQPQATADTLTPDGWFRTGDIGYVDAAGYTFIVDRLKELIKYKGFQVAPAELEALLLSHPAIADVAVIPSPDEEAGEVPKAFVVRRADNGSPSAEEVMAWVAERVSPHKRVRRLDFVEQIPKSPSGKILRRVLIDLERAAQAG